MLMKKFTLAVSMLCMTALSSFADSKFGSWTLNGEETKLENYTFWGASYNTLKPGIANQTVVTSDGAQVVTGYSLSMMTGMQQAIITKTGANGWTRSIASAEITAAVADNAGGIYVAGVFGSSLTIGDKSLTGYKDSENNKCASFIAHYDKDGNLQAANSIVPSLNKEIAEKYEYYGQGANSVYAQVNQLLTDGTNTYAVVAFTDILSTADGSKTNVSGNYYYDYYGYMFGGSTKSYTVAKLDDNLSISDFVFTVKGNDYSDPTNYGCDAYSTVATIADSHLYVATTFKGNGSANGNLIAGQNDPVKLSIKLNEGGCKASVLADVNLSDMAMNYKLYDGNYTWDSDGKGENAFKAIYANGDNLILTGSSTGSSLFDETKTAKGSADVFVASVKKADFSTDWTALSGVEENGEELELANASTINGDKVYVGSLTAEVANGSSYTLKAPYLYAVDTKTGEMQSVATTEYVASMAAASEAGQIYVSSFANQTTTVNLGLYNTRNATGISGVKAEQTGDMKIYNLQGQRLSAPVKGQINIINGKKVVY